MVVDKNINCCGNTTLIGRRDAAIEARDDRGEERRMVTAGSCSQREEMYCRICGRKKSGRNRRNEGLEKRKRVAEPSPWYVGKKNNSRGGGSPGLPLPGNRLRRSPRHMLRNKRVRQGVLGRPKTEGKAGRSRRKEGSEKSKGEY